MRLEHLCDGEYRYDAAPVVVTPFDGGEAIGFGGGRGRLSGDRLSGTLRWSNFPRRREDGTFLPALTGVVETADGATILFETHGVSLPPEQGTSHRVISSAVRFHAEDDAHRWLNDVLAVEEGRIDMTTGVVHTSVWVCVPDRETVSPTDPT